MNQVYSHHTFGMACSPKAWLARGTWKTDSIRRYVRHDRDKEMPGDHRAAFNRGENF